MDSTGQRTKVPPMHDGDDQDLPDISGLTPVRSLADLRRPTAAASVRERCAPLDALRRGFGYDAFRPFQGEAVSAALDGKDALVVLPTGGGKSVCYQLPAACGAGLVLVVSPLIALMDDQVASAREAGLNAGALHGNLDESERRAVRRSLDDGTLDLLYVSPERLLVGDLMPQLVGRVALLAVDEAHCVSHWGHDFRPEYRQLRSVFDQAPHVPRMALTATATPGVQDDICVQLGLRSPKRLVGHMDRANLIYRALPRHEGTKQALDVIQRHPGEGGIVYAQTRAEVERLAAALKKAGVQVAAYHAGLPAEVRAKVQSDFVNERLAVVVATIAFGMGIDRSNVRYVVHANTPKSIEHYQQEAGRAGRDGDPAECVLLYGAADLVTHRRLATMDGALSPDRAQALERQLRAIGRFAVAPVCRHRLLCEHFGQTYTSPGDGCGACDVCLGETKEMPADQALITAQKIISAAWRLEGRFGPAQTVSVLLGERTEKVERAGHDKLTVFGLLAEAGEASLRAWVDQLCVQGFLALREDGVYSFLVVTDAGRALCRGEGTVRLGLVAARPRATKRKAATSGAGTVVVSIADEALFERLRALRKLLAAKAGVPPYVVFHDATLHEIAAQKPADANALMAVKGLGERKVARYGAAVLAVVAGGEPAAVASAAAQA